MANTLVASEQVVFKSAQSGETNLDTYLEAAEIGGRSLGSLLGDIFDVDGSPVLSGLSDWKGNWATATAYVAGDTFRSNSGVTEHSIYVALSSHTSSSIAGDVTAVNIALVIDGATLLAAAAASASTADASADASAADRVIVAADKATVASDKAVVAADKATVAADKAIVAADKVTAIAAAAAASDDADAAEVARLAAVAAAASAGLPTAVANTYLVRNAGNTAYDTKSAGQVRTHLSLVPGTDVLAPSGSGAALTGLIKQGTHTIWVPAAAMKSRTTNGPAALTSEMTTNKNMVLGLDFDASTIEYAQFGIPMPKSWDEGTVTAAFRWRHASTTTNFKVSWGLQAVAISDDDTLDVAFGTAQYANDIGGTTNDKYDSPVTAAITIGGTPQTEDFVLFQVLRKADDGTNDTLAIDGTLLGVTLYYTVNAGDDA